MVAGMPDGEPGPRPATRFTDVRRFGQVDSTNRVAADLARGGAAEGLVIVADHQTAGRGRRGRSWVAPPGSSLLATVVLRPPLDCRPACATVACALAAADACNEVAGFLPALKWPNDLSVAGRKLAGVLAEHVDGPDHPVPAALVVGLGLNLVWPGPFPAELASRAVTAGQAAGHPVDRDALLDAWLAHLEGRYRDLSEAGGRATLDDYRRRCATVGRAVRVELPGGRVMEGVATGIDDDASLLVASAGGERRVTAGDVVHLDGPSS
jgi:BirA family biotin operon repressor/biotin-[acetyl-CoA-carboxylase] ligase